MAVSCTVLCMKQSYGVAPFGPLGTYLWVALLNVSVYSRWNIPSEVGLYSLLPVPIQISHKKSGIHTTFMVPQLAICSHLCSRIYA